MCQSEAVYCVPGSEGFSGALFTATILTRDRDVGGDRTRTRRRQQTGQIPSGKAVDRRAMMGRHRTASANLTG